MDLTTGDPLPDRYDQNTKEELIAWVLKNAQALKEAQAQQHLEWKQRSNKKNPDAPEGYWDYPSVFAGHYTSEGPRYDRPMPLADIPSDDDDWMPYYASSKRGGNGHIADPFTPRRHFGMFTLKGNRAVELFAQRWRDAYLEGRETDWERDVLPELEQLASLPGMEEATETDVRERIIGYIEEGDKMVEMGGETYHFPSMVTPDYYSEPGDY